jgi:hypothetical protein
LRLNLLIYLMFAEITGGILRTVPEKITAAELPQNWRLRSILVQRHKPEQ